MQLWREIHAPLLVVLGCRLLATDDAPRDLHKPPMPIDVAPRSLLESPAESTQEDT